MHCTNPIYGITKPSNYESFLRILCIICGVTAVINSSAQCPNSYNQVTLNWNCLDYFSYTSNYTSASGYLSSISQAQTQYFAFGTQRLKVVRNYMASNAPGENTGNTAEAGAYGTGADVQFISNGAVNFTFDNAVQNIKFSIFDIDKSQVITVTALNGVTSQGVTITRVLAGTLTIGGTATAPTTTANNTTVSNSNINSTVNVDIAGPITSFTVNGSGTLGVNEISSKLHLGINEDDELVTEDKVP